MTKAAVRRVQCQPHINNSPRQNNRGQESRVGGLTRGDSCITESLIIALIFQRRSCQSGTESLSDGLPDSLTSLVMMAAGNETGPDLQGDSTAVWLNDTLIRHDSTGRLLLHTLALSLSLSVPRC